MRTEFNLTLSQILTRRKQMIKQKGFIAMSEPVINASFQRVGGIRFLSIGRFRFSFCLAGLEPAPRKSRRDAMRAAKSVAFSRGWSEGWRMAKGV
jgi:hypothetical protein